MDTGPSSPHGSKRLRAPTFGSSFSLQTLDEHANGGASVSNAPVYEISVSGRNRARMLSRVSTALFDVGLNISEAHVFCTGDGYALDVFVVQGWAADDAANLNQILTARLAQVNWDDAGKPGAGGSVGGSRGPRSPPPRTRPSGRSPRRSSTSTTKSRAARSACSTAGTTAGRRLPSRF